MTCKAIRNCGYLVLFYVAACLPLQPACAQRKAMTTSQSRAGAEMLMLQLHAYPAPTGRSVPYEAYIYGPGRLRFTAAPGKGKPAQTRHFVLQAAYIKNLAVALQKAKFLAIPDSLPVLPGEQKIRIAAFSQGRRKTIVFSRQTANTDLHKLFEEIEANLQAIATEQEPMADTLEY